MPALHGLLYKEFLSNVKYNYFEDQFRYGEYVMRLQTNPMQQNPSSQTDSNSASQEIPHLLRYLKVNFFFQLSTTPWMRIGWVDVYLHEFFTLALDGGE